MTTPMRRAEEPPPQSSGPTRWVEPAIAFSVAYVGFENLVPRAPRGRWLLVFGFGLVHGLGFASVLREIGLPRRGLLLSLLSFHSWNATVEGLASVPARERPPVNVVRIAFQTMVGIGSLLALIGVVFIAVQVRWKRLPE